MGKRRVPMGLPTKRLSPAESKGIKNLGGPARGEAAAPRLSDHSEKPRDRAPGPWPWSSGRAPASGSVPGERPTVLIFDDARFEEVLFLLQVHRFRHPQERIFGLGENRCETDLRATAVGDEVHVLLAKAGIQTQEAARHRVPPVSRLEFGRFTDHIAHLVLKGRRPQMRILDLDLV